MYWLILIALSLQISLLESTLFCRLDFFGIKPELFLVIVVLCAIHLEILEASLAACLMGLAKDILSEGPLGLNASFFICLCLLIGLSRDKIYNDHILSQILIVLIASLVYRGGSALIVSLSFQSISPATLLWKVFMGSLYTAALAPGPYFLFKKFFPLVSLRRRRCTLLD